MLSFPLSFLRPEGPCPARLMVVGEFPAEIDVAQAQVFVGNAGRELSSLLHETGIRRSETFLTYALQFRPPEGDVGSVIALRSKDITPSHRPFLGKSVLPAVWESAQILYQQINLCQPSCIIALGNVALWALTGIWGVDKWRGSELHPEPSLGLSVTPWVVPTYSVNRLFAEWDKRQILIRDLRRAIVRRDYPEILPPENHITLSPSYPTVIALLSSVLSRLSASPLKLAIDIETRLRHITCLGLAWSKTEALCIPFTSYNSQDYWEEQEEASILHLLYRILTHKNLIGIGQNFLYDAQYILRYWHFIPNLSRDTMIAQHSMFSNMPKGLDFLASMYCERYVYWKDMHKASGKDEA